MSFLRKLFGKPAQPDLLDWRGFTARVAEYLSAKGYPAEVEWGGGLEDTAVHVRTGGQQGQLYMGNFYVRYTGDPQALDEVLDVIARTAAAMGQEETVTREQIMPVVKSADFLAQVRQMMQSGEQSDDVPFRALAGELVLMYVADCGETMCSVGQAELAGLGVADENGLFALALENLRHYCSGQGAQIIGSESGLFMVRLDGTYEASLLLDLDRLAAAAELAGTELLCAVPARDMLMFCAADNAAARADMENLAADVAAEGNYLISGSLYRWRDGVLSIAQTDNTSIMKRPQTVIESRIIAARAAKCLCYTLAGCVLLLAALWLTPSVAQPQTAVCLTFQAA